MARKAGTGNRAVRPRAKTGPARRKSRQGGTAGRSSDTSNKPERTSRNAFGLRKNQDWYGVATEIVTIEAQGRERRVRTGGLRRLYRRPAQRPRHKLVGEVSNEEIAKLLSGFAHPQRVAIVKAIFSGAGTYADLREKVGLKAGPMYHHLRELRLAGVLADGPRDVYRLTRQGTDALVMACSLASIRDSSARGS